MSLNPTSFLPPSPSGRSNKKQRQDTQHNENNIEHGTNEARNSVQLMNDSMCVEQTVQQQLMEHDNGTLVLHALSSATKLALALMLHTSRVRPELVTSLARFMSPASRVFLQSDVQSILDEMRLQFRQQSEYFRDARQSIEVFLSENIVVIPNEREVSVWEQNLPVYRALFTRTEQQYSTCLFKEEAEVEGG
ncbi:tRNA guanine-N7-methyltransferase [Nitzschia inconspicua]|uniref:tRNA guanine-N7-methyltransferase n=1 Tax=Nitzschia inconspicua TaxID=303405 RepID=A0A9K3KCE7_9STRA|nr:tRNA guanine-N7-methyltransferase [Nitzschia inconspicua]